MRPGEGDSERHEATAMAIRLGSMARLFAGVAALSLLGACAGGGGLGKTGSGSSGRLAARWAPVAAGAWSRLPMGRPLRSIERSSR